MEPEKTGTCIECGRKIGVTKKQTIKAHGHLYRTGKTKQQRTDNCAGSFLPAKEIATIEAYDWLERKKKGKEKRIRERMEQEGKTKNPAPNQSKNMYAAMVKAAEKGQALNAAELARRIKAKRGTVEKVLEDLAAQGKVRKAGRDSVGMCWVPGEEQRAPFDNPTKPTKAAAAKRALKKAKAWFWEEEEVTEPQELKGYRPPSSGVLIGEITAIEYRSRKDGRMKTYRHDVTKKRNLIISVDGGTLIVDPPFKITKRGIEG